ncbi:MAG TPA: fumarylacetoacetate hydrolase family protein [Chloroflexota bacterium]|nr:fumarylacetoacetate hydrolase family protein [Chloroflexota bacterium]
MRYLSFEHAGQASWGAIVEGTIVDFFSAGAALGFAIPETLLGFIQLGPAHWSQANRIDAAFRSGRLSSGLYAVSDVRVLAPIPRPAKNIFALGLNYAEHVAEGGSSRPLPDAPIYFTKVASNVVGPDQPVVDDPELTVKLDWEAELAFVIGTGGRRISQDQALSHVFGYTILNDISARDVQSGRGGQWFLGKNLQGSCPMGPYLVSADEIPDPQALEISLRVDGVEKQHSNTRQQIFSVARVIADVSRYLALESGDIFTTGTPSGVGSARRPPEFLHPGDVVEAEIQSIGVLRTPIVGPSGQ